jgi:Ca2+:H+ antiporter
VFCAESMISNIGDITVPNSTVSTKFVDLILLPIVSNAGEHTTAVTIVYKDKMDLAIGIAIGSSIQIALFVFFFIIVVCWGLGYDCINLSFDGFQIAVLFVSDLYKCVNCVFCVDKFDYIKVLTDVPCFN